jgi:hypothetical protein
VYTRLVREFYGYLEVFQDDDRVIILQTTVEGQTIQIDPQAISTIIGIPVQPISTNLFSGVIEPPSIKQLWDFFGAHPQGDEHAHAHIKIHVFSLLYRLLAKIGLHNLWPTTHRSELVFKMAQFLYALCMRMPFCLCKHILNRTLEMRDVHFTGLPFACLVTNFCF